MAKILEKELSRGIPSNIKMIRDQLNNIPVFNSATEESKE